jgi:hypothetical protein
MKRLKINFAAGEEQQDLDLALRSIADGKIDVTPWLGTRVGLNGRRGSAEPDERPLDSSADRG